MNVKVSREYVAASVNRYPNTCDWGNRLIAFASCHSVCVYDKESLRVTEVLVGDGHTGEVRSVRWIVPDELMVSGASSKDAIVWKKSGDEFKKLLHLKGHSSPILVADSLEVAIDGDNHQLLTVTSTSDFVISVFINGTLKSQASLKHFMFDIKLVNCSKFSSKVLIILGSENGLVHIGFVEIPSGQIEQIIPLNFGHQDWIRSVDAFPMENQLLIASSSQDSFVRVLRVVRSSSAAKPDVNRQLISNNDEFFEVSLETVLAGHEASVDCVKWIDDKNIMTSSLDKTIIVWTNSENDDIWMESLRVGEVGGNNMGFLGCTFPKRTSEFKTFAGHSYNGSVHIWIQQNGQWMSSTGFGGHFDSVVDVSWDPDGNYLLSTSYDETTRLHGFVKQTNSWHELSRPQIHGYLINSLATIDHLTFASGADEKVVRIFKATKTFVQLEKLTGRPNLVSGADIESLPISSMVPSLGLTNRAVYNTDHQGDRTDNSKDILIKPDVTNIPTEETLMTSTLWPEIHKLYGHGNELLAIACDHDGHFLATACKASKPDQADIIIWDIRQDYKLWQRLPGHSLTVTSMKFSSDNQFLVSVSRDRTWFLFRRGKNDLFVKVANTDKKSCIHGRIIWDVAWLPDERSFLTVSRDKKAIIWNITEDSNDEFKVSALEQDILTLDHSVMTCDAFKTVLGSRVLICFGLEDGSILLYTWSRESWKKINSGQRHHLSVRKVRFNQVYNERAIFLASSSDDRSVQIFHLFSY